MTVLIVGADGMIGRALADSLSKDDRAVTETTRRPGATGSRRIPLDLSADPSTAALPDSRQIGDQSVPAVLPSCAGGAGLPR
jgi:nucleoside-diphosphate-sugar epimerase